MFIALSYLMYANTVKIYVGILSLFMKEMKKYLKLTKLSYWTIEKILLRYMSQLIIHFIVIICCFLVYILIIPNLLKLNSV